jgi:hypothetical protein
MLRPIHHNLDKEKIPKTFVGEKKNPLKLIVIVLISDISIK